MSRSLPRLSKCSEHPESAVSIVNQHPAPPTAEQTRAPRLGLARSRPAPREVVSANGDNVTAGATARRRGSRLVYAGSWSSSPPEAPASVGSFRARRGRSPSARRPACRVYSVFFSRAFSSRSRTARSRGRPAARLLRMTSSSEATQISMPAMRSTDPRSRRPSNDRMP